MEYTDVGLLGKCALVQNHSLSTFFDRDLHTGVSLIAQRFTRMIFQITQGEKSKPKFSLGAALDAGNCSRNIIFI